MIITLTKKVDAISAKTKQKLYMVGITQNKQECLTLIVVPL